MIRSITLLAIFMAAGLYTSAQQLANGGFEEGIGSSHADSWNSINEITSPPGSAGFSRTKDSYSGNWACRLESFLFFGQKVPGLASLGKIGIGSVSGGIAFTGRPIALTGAYKRENGGSSLIAVILTRSTEAGRDTVGSGSLVITDNQASYQSFKLNINYTSSESPDSMNIILLTGQNTPRSTLYVDELELDYTVSSFSEPLASDVQQVSFYPNPCKNRLTLELAQGTSAHFQIVDLTGKVVKSGIVQDNSQIDLSGVPVSLYQLVILENNGRRSTHSLSKR